MKKQAKTKATPLKLYSVNIPVGGEIQLEIEARDESHLKQIMEELEDNAVMARAFWQNEAIKDGEEILDFSDWSFDEMGE